MELGLKDKVAIVTGAGWGIGKAAATETGVSGALTTGFSSFSAEIDISDFALSPSFFEEKHPVKFQVKINTINRINKYLIS